LAGGAPAKQVGIGPDRTDANAGIADLAFDRTKVFVRCFDCMHATRFRPKLCEDRVEALSSAT
jgi:hypothetical protein